MQHKKREYVHVSYDVEKDIARKIKDLAKVYDVRESDLVNEVLKEGLVDLEEKRTRPRREEIITQPLNI